MGAGAGAGCDRLRDVSVTDWRTLKVGSTVNSTDFFFNKKLSLFLICQAITKLTRGRATQ